MRRPRLLLLLRIVLRRRPADAHRPLDPADYERPDLDGHGPPVDAIPVAHTGDVQDPFPPAVLADCRQPLLDGAPDLRGVWLVERGALRGTVHRIEQAGDRVVVTAGRLVHDMRADGTLQHGVHDVDPNAGEIRVAAEFVDGRLDLRPQGGRVLVSRWLDADDPDVLHWRYGPFRNRCRRLTTPTG